MKFKKGDRVMVRNDLKVHTRYGNHRVWMSMEKWKGESVTISKIVDDLYKIAQDDEDYWTEEMFVSMFDPNDEGDDPNG